MTQLEEYRSKLIGRLEAATEEFRSACLAIGDPFKAADEGGWNTHQVVVHTRDVDKLVYSMRIRRTVEEENPGFENFDQDAWMTAHYSLDEPFASILDELSASVKRPLLCCESYRLKPGAASPVTRFMETDSRCRLGSNADWRTSRNIWKL